MKYKLTEKQKEFERFIMTIIFIITLPICVYLREIIEELDEVGED